MQSAGCRGHRRCVPLSWHRREGAGPPVLCRPFGHQPGDPKGKPRSKLPAAIETIQRELD